MATLRFVDVLDPRDFGLVPPCADTRFDHRTCDYWEDADHGTKRARAAWLTNPSTEPSGAPAPLARSDNPFAPATKAVDNPFASPATPSNPFASTGGAAVGGSAARSAALAALAGDDGDDDSSNPFAPARSRAAQDTRGLPRKLALLVRGRDVFGSYAKLALEADEPVSWAQFGPLSAYPRASRLRELYPKLPDSPLPAVITCIATTAAARHRGHAVALVEEICRDLASRGFSAVEAYPDLTLPEDETSAGRPGFWLRCGFRVAADDDRFPVMRRELD